MNASRQWSAADLPCPAAPRVGIDLHAEDIAERYRAMRERERIAPTRRGFMARIWARVGRAA